MRRFGLGVLVSAAVLVAPAVGGADVVVQTVEVGRSAARAGLRPGDRLLEWTGPGGQESAAADRRPLKSPFDVWRLELRQMPVEIAVARPSGDFVASLPPGKWGLETRPVLKEPALSKYRRATDLIEQGAFDAGTERLQRLALSLRQDDPERACWLLQDAGERLARTARWAESEQLYSQAAGIAASSNRLGLEAYLRYTQGEVLFETERYDESEAALRAATEKWAQTAPRGLAVAAAIAARGKLALAWVKLEAAEMLFSESLAIRQEWPDASLARAESLAGLGTVALRRGDLRAAERLLGEALPIQEAKAPDGLEVVDTLNNLAVVAWRAGSYEKATARAERAFSIVEELAPESRSMATSLGTRGKLAWLAGDLSHAEDLQRRALAIEETRNPNSDWTSTHLINLAAVLVHRRELEAAEKLYLRALKIEERISPESRGVAILLGNLGHVATERGNYEDARTFLLRSIAIKDKVAPDSVSLAVGLENLGRVAGRLGQIGRAEEFHHQAVDIIERKAPESLRLADNYYELGDLATRREAFEEAREFHQRALDIRSRFEPGSYKEAESRFALARLARTTGDDLDAVRWLRGSIEALETQTTRLGGRQEVRAEFAATYLNYYQQLIRALVELDRLEEAFHYIERSRSRTLLSMLAERELVLDSAIPADLKQERERIEADYDRAQAELAKLDEASSPAEVEQLRAQQRELHDSLERLKTRLRQLSPRLEALEYPEPFDLARARKVLAPGTLLLSYVVTEEETLLFAVQPSMVPGVGLSVFRIEIGREVLARRVSIFRSLIERSRNSTDVERALREQGRHLYGLLLGPAREAIGAADRLLVSADGPLHMLPFSALVRDTGNQASPGFEYLVEWKPLHRTMSATVYGELSEGRRNGRAGQPIQIAAFADPEIPAESDLDGGRPQDDVLRGLLSDERGFDLGRLPQSREEVRTIAELWGDEARVFVGHQATEEQVAAIGKTARMFHFATHSLLDEDAPLNSSLVLATGDRQTPEGENGLLQAWEIFEKLNIDADLVALSACQTALGREIGGEGLVGLARAFQFAGARSVLASLWSVSDRSTTELMRRFYVELRSGRCKDEALRTAQIALIRGQDSMRSPFHWAAFELIGNWR